MMSDKTPPALEFHPAEAPTPPAPTLLLALLDESGSMQPRRADTIGGFNQFLADQQQGPGACRLALTTFGNHVRPVHGPRDIAAVEPLTEQGYRPGGGTALFDAIAHIVHEADAARQLGERVVCLIITDGEENSSKTATRQQVMDLIATHEATGHWTFVYLGAEPTAWTNMGVAQGNAAAYQAATPKQSYHHLSVATMAFRSSDQMRSSNYLVSVGKDDRPTS